MKLALVLGILAAATLHGGFLLFGGLILPQAKTEEQIQEVELVEEITAPEPEKEEEKVVETTDEVEAEEEEPPPEVEDVLPSTDVASTDDAPALEAASLSAIEAALSGLGGGGDFAEALTFGSGGVIGGTGVVGGRQQEFEEAFSLDQIDQKPVASYQESPLYPQSMRGKKLEGLVTIEFVVDATGKVVNPRVTESTHTAFEEPALKAIRRWKFEPAFRGGQRVPAKMRVPIRFPQG
jgi:protein TonB